MSLTGTLEGAMKVKEISVVVVNVGADFTHKSATTASMDTRSQTAVSFRFEIDADEILLLGLKEEAVDELGKAISRALLAFAQADEGKWEEKGKPDEGDPNNLQ